MTAHAANGQRTTTVGHLPLPQQLRDRDKPRLADYVAALDFYNGRQWATVRNAQTTRLRRLTINYIRAITDKTSSFVMAGAAIGVHPTSETEDALIAAAGAEQVLADIAANNSLPRLDLVTEVDTAVLGDGAYKVTWDPETETVNITAPDMSGIYPWPHPTDPSRFRRVAQRYQLPAEDIFARWLIAPKHNPAWVIEDWTDKTFDIYVDDPPTPQIMAVNPYGFIPFVIFPNQQVPKRWWGTGDVLPNIEIARELNAEFSRLSNIVELSGNPIAVLEGIDEAKDIETFPGATWTLPGSGKAHVLDLLKDGAVRQHLEYLDRLLRAFHDISETPKTAFGDTERDISGIALEVELQPLLQKVERKRLIRTDAFRTRAEMSLQIHDQFTGSNHRNAGAITVTFAPATPRDHTRQVADEAAQIEAGVKSHRTSMADLGVQDPDAEFARWLDEQRQIRALDNTATTK